MLASPAARLQLVDSAHLFLALKIVAPFSAWPAPPISPGSSQILWTKLCASAARRVHLLDFPQETPDARFLSIPQTSDYHSSRQDSSHFLWTKL
jgi:hypothetical protein